MESSCPSDYDLTSFTVELSLEERLGFGAGYLLRRHRYEAQLIWPSMRPVGTG